MSRNDDISALIEAFDPLMVMRVALCQLSIQDVQNIIQRVGKVEINIGDGLTLLHQAASHDRDDLVELLCSLGHSTEVKTIHGETPLDQAAWQGRIHSALELIKYKADIDCQTNGKYSPLHRCAYYNHPRLASLLVLAGADQTIVDENGQTAYEVAVQAGNIAVQEILRPIYDENGRNIAGIAYATNNPKHPNFRPEARDALFALFALDQSLENEREEDGDGEEDGDDGDEDGDEGNEDGDNGEDEGDVNENNDNEKNSDE